MSGPKGFRAFGVHCGLKQSDLDLALVHNIGPRYDAAAVFTTNDVKAAPVLWSEQIIKTGKCKAVLINSGGANACTGAKGFAVTHRSAEHLATRLGIDPLDVAVCSTGIIGEQLNGTKIESGINQLTNAKESDGLLAAKAIMTTDSKPKQELVEASGYSIGGMAKGAGMLAPGLATMLVILTTDADLSELPIEKILADCVEQSFNRITSDGSMSTNDTVILMANGSSGAKPEIRDFTTNLLEVCDSLAKQIIRDAEGATVFVEVIVEGATAEDQALKVARKIADDLLVKTALFGRDPNWGRIAAAAGSAGAKIDPNRLDIWLNGELVCLAGEANGDRDRVKLDGDEVEIKVQLNLGSYSSRVLTTDLSTAYVLENSDYSS
ncbi:MAG: bifunctional glutamate N-acetyltransferase/amino-acid acetyltransferase ArgJ [Candidatus Nanopelagicales bacterium]